MMQKILLVALLLLVAGCEPNANAASRRYNACVAMWTTEQHRTFDKGVHEACLRIAGLKPDAKA